MQVPLNPAEQRFGLGFGQVDRSFIKRAMPPGVLKESPAELTAVMMFPIWPRPLEFIPARTERHSLVSRPPALLAPAVTREATPRAQIASTSCG